MPHIWIGRLFDDWCSRRSFELSTGFLHIISCSLVGFVGCRLLTSTPVREMWALRTLLRKYTTCGLEICGLSLSASVGFDIRSYSGLETKLRSRDETFYAL